MIGLLVPPDADPRAVEFAEWGSAAAAVHLVNPRVLTWRDFRIAGSPMLGRMFYDREYWAGGQLLPRNEPATRLISRQLSAAAYVPRFALILRTEKVGVHGLRQLQGLTVEDALVLATTMVLNEQRAIEA